MKQVKERCPLTSLGAPFRNIVPTRPPGGNIDCTASRCEAHKWLACALPSRFADGLRSVCSLPQML